MKKKNIVRYVAQLATEKGTWTELAKKMKVSPQAVQKWGRNKHFPYSRIEQVSKLTGIDRNVFLDAIPQKKQ